MKYVFLFLTTLMLASCFGTTTEPEKSSTGAQLGSGSVQQKSIKQNENTFFIETKKISDFNTQNQIEKIGQILPNQSLDIAPQVSGEISQIHVQEGQKVGAGQVLISLKDSYSRYGLEVEKAQIDLEKQEINK